MELGELIKDIYVGKFSEEELATKIKSIKIRSEEVENGDLFILLKNDELAKDKVRMALENGAEMVLCENDFGLKNCHVIEKPRRAFALMEKRLHHDAVDKMKVIGVTGTNGKTTISHIIYDILKNAGKKVGLVGTLGIKTSGEYEDTGFTTPDPDVLHEAFEKMLQEGCEYVVMEASAHALILDKLEGINFEVGILTNITQDHLDFFGNMQNYYLAKLKLFENSRCKIAFVCSDCVNSKKIAKDAGANIFTYGVTTPSNTFASNVNLTSDGSSFICQSGDKIFDVQVPLVGNFNVQNTLAAISACLSLGVSVEHIQSALKFMPPVEGRFNVIKKGDVNVVVDFAHTPDGLDKIISSARSFTSGRIITVFGCGGDRDRLKRPIMGEIATRLSDFVVFSSDNPRFEKPDEIIEEIKKGAIRQNYIAEPDRSKAILLALKQAKAGDTVIIAGKGGEKYQDICGQKIPYDDYSVVLSFDNLTHLEEENITCQSPLKPSLSS